MIPFLDPSSLFASVILAQVTTCPQQPAPPVEMHFENKPPVVSSAFSDQQMNQIPLDTKVAHKRDEILTTKGLTITNLAPSYKFGFKATKNKDTGEVCLWLDKVQVTVSYAPEIYIAQEYPEGSCKHKEVYNHELKHANTTVITINKYLPKIQQALQDTVNLIGVASLPNETFINTKKEEMGKKVADSALDQVDKMYKANLLYQQNIDTRQEYMRISKACQ